MEIREQVPLYPYTTFQVGGRAQYFATVRSRTDIKDVLLWAHEKNLACRILAGGSNIVVSDEGVSGVVMHLVSNDREFCGTTLVADAGSNLLDLIKESSKQSLGGWESMAGIPGSLGGAIRGNAGAFGTTVDQVLVAVEALHMHTGEYRVFNLSELNCGYRSSFFKYHPEWIIMRAKLQFARGSREESVQKMHDTIAEREKRHLQNVRAAGSYFMNPKVSAELGMLFQKEKGVVARDGRVPAGWLVEKAGVKGYRSGDAMTSAQHANYVVNVGHATAEHVRAVAEHVRRTVHRLFDTRLEDEVSHW
ncbi:MAG: UDP-N-acetylmuramate dehydrogenase [Patescibacteria group bacterium]